MQVKFEDREARVIYRPTETNPPTLVKKMEDLGFKATIMDIQRTASGGSGDSMRKIAIDVEGMTCQSCVKNIEGNITNLDGVKHIKVSLENKKALVVIDSSQTSADAVAEGISNMGFDAKVAPEEGPASERTAVIGIEGMTCNSCVRTIESSIGGVPGITAIKVSLADQEGTVTYDPQVVKATEIAGVIENMGFDTKVLQQEDESLSDDEFAQIASSRVSSVSIPRSCVLNIKGMTCHSCVRNIESHIGNQPGIISIRVSLADSNGVVHYDPKVTDPPQIMEMVNNMGFDTTVAELELVPIGNSATALNRSSSATQTATIDIQGMSCNSCVKKIESKLGAAAGIHSAKVSLADSNCQVTFDPSLVSVGEIAQMIRDLGYRTSTDDGSGEKSRMQTTVVTVKGMTCHSCVKAIEGKLSEHPAVKSIHVSLPEEKATIEYDASKATPQMLADAITDAGFDASLAGNDSFSVCACACVCVCVCVCACVCMRVCMCVGDCC